MPLHVRAARAAEPAQRPIAAHHHHVEHVGREVPIHAAALRHIAHLPALLGIGPAVDPHLPGRDRSQAQDGLHQRRLPRAVRADHRHQHPARHVQVHIPQHRLVVIGDGQVGDFNGWLHL